MRVLNITQGTLIAGKAERACGLLARTKGLLGRTGLDTDQGLLIHPCQGIHTFFMRFAIDALFLDKHNKVQRAVRAIPPNRIGPLVLKASSVLELPSGTIEATGTREGDILSISD